MDNCWPYPGSRWWKFDFHTHTPASLDTIWNGVIGTPNKVTPEKWLLQFMAEEIDCVVVSDHNSGEWIDRLKTAYDQMKENPSEGFRKLTLFPAVELSVNGGFHLLAIFDTDADTSKIDNLIGAVKYEGKKGDSNGVTRKSAVEVIDAVLRAGGIPIPAHVDQKKGLLRLEKDSNRAALDANTLRQVLENSEMLAMEQVDPSVSLPALYTSSQANWTSVLGSDCHSFRGDAVPGSRFTWVKMASPCLEGLRLSLIDGNGVSIRRSDESTSFSPSKTPEFFIESIEIDKARYMGNGKPQKLAFSPYMNALVGGRGTGKSTVVHALRLAFSRASDLKRFDQKDSPLSEFEGFRRQSNSRNEKGAIKSNTSIKAIVKCNGVRHRLVWSAADGSIQVEDEVSEGDFQLSQHQTMNPDRFPLRIFSQGQVAAMAGEGRRALLDIIDEAAGISEIQQRFDEAKSTWLSQRARLRALDARLANKGETERKLTDVQKKLGTFNTSQHAEILKAYSRVSRQKRETGMVIDQLEPVPEKVATMLEQLQLDDSPENIFDPDRDKDIIEWKQKANGLLHSLKQEIRQAVDGFAKGLEALKGDPMRAQWQSRIQKITRDYESLKAQLAEKGVDDPHGFDKLVQERQKFETDLRNYQTLENDRSALLQQIEEQFEQIKNYRKKTTQERKQFLDSKLSGNEHVKIEVVPFGYDPHEIENDFRELIGVTDGRFESDILSKDSNGKDIGLLADLYESGISEIKIEQLKENLDSDTPSVGGHFRNYLKQIKANSDFSDRLWCWFPEDDLRVSYKRDKDFVPISQGSKGQRAAAILAFLLAFGEEPLVLDQPEDDLDNHLIYDLIVRQMRENKLRRQLIVATHNPNIVVNGDAEMVFAFAFNGQCHVPDQNKGSLQESGIREEVCRVMEGGHEAFSRRWERLGKKI